MTAPAPTAAVAYVKMRERGKRAFFFVNSKGEGTRLRIHAARFPDKAAAEAFIARHAAENPELEFIATE